MRKGMKYISYTQKITFKSIFKKLIDNIHMEKVTGYVLHLNECTK